MVVQLKGLEVMLDVLCCDQCVISQCLQDVVIINCVLCDEMLGFLQCSVLLEENLVKLVDSVNQGCQVVQCDEVELLLIQVVQCLNYVDDVDGVCCLYVQVVIVLVELFDIEGLNLCQVLVQECEVLDVFGSGLCVQLLQCLDVVVWVLQGLFLQIIGMIGSSIVKFWWQVMLVLFVDIILSCQNGLLIVVEQCNVDDVLQLELILVCVVIECGDCVGCNIVLDCVEQWVQWCWLDLLVLCV